MEETELLPWGEVSKDWPAPQGRGSASPAGLMRAVRGTLAPAGIWSLKHLSDAGGAHGHVKTRRHEGSCGALWGPVGSCRVLWGPVGSWYREEQVGTPRKQDTAWPAVPLTPPRWLINGHTVLSWRRMIASTGHTGFGGREVYYLLSSL